MSSKSKVKNDDKTNLNYGRIKIASNATREIFSKQAKHSSRKKNNISLNLNVTVKVLGR